MLLSGAEAQGWITKDQLLSPAGKALEGVVSDVPEVLDHTCSSLSLFFFVGH